MRILPTNEKDKVLVTKDELQQQFVGRLTTEGSVPQHSEGRPSSHTSSEFVTGIRSPSPIPQQPSKDEEGMWRPW